MSLEQGRCKRILSLMYKLSKNDTNRKVSLSNTRQQDKYIFRTDAKIGMKYLNNPYCKGTKLWNILTREMHFSESVCIDITERYRNEISNRDKKTFR